MSVYELNRAIHSIYVDRATAMRFRAGDASVCQDYDLSNEERRALEGRDFPAMWALHAHPVLLFHLSITLHPREWYLENVVPLIENVPNRWYDYYANPPDHPPESDGRQ